MSERGRVTYPLLLCLSAAGRSFFVMSLPMCVPVCVRVCVCQVDAKITVNRTQHATEAKSAQSK